jgi:chromate transporter
MAAELKSPTFDEALRVWVKIGLLSFGGPAGQIALMHRELVENRRWLSDRRFLHALNYCMLLPGPEAQQLAIYTGWLLHKTRGGLVAGALFVLPGALLMFAISWIYIVHGQLPWIAAVFYGLKAAVMAIVAAAMIRLGRKILTNPVMWAIAALSFAGIFFLGLPFPLIVLSALALGWFGCRRFPGIFQSPSGHGDLQAAGDEIADLPPPPGIGRTLGKAFAWAAVWLLPLATCLFLLGPQHVFTQQGAFFSKAALVTFGGAYAVLPYVGQQAVETHGWLSATQMMDGLGLAETTPGPLILVLQFVGFIGGWNGHGTLAPIAAAAISSFLTVWATFIPGYLFIFLGAPYIERTRGHLRLNSALTAVTAAVCGVILNLAVWFGIHLVRPEPGKSDAVPLALAAVFLILLQTGKATVPAIIGLGAACGLLIYLIG